MAKTASPNPIDSTISTVWYRVPTPTSDLTPAQVRSRRQHQSLINSLNLDFWCKLSRWAYIGKDEDFQTRDNFRTAKANANLNRKIVAMYADGVELTEIGDKYGIPRQTVFNKLKTLLETFAKILRENPSLFEAVDDTDHFDRYGRDFSSKQEERRHMARQLRRDQEAASNILKHAR